MTDLPISGMPADTFAADLEFPAVDPALSSNKNVKILGSQISALVTAGVTGETTRAEAAEAVLTTGLATAMTDIATLNSEVAALEATGHNAPKAWFHPGSVSNTGTYEMRFSFNETLTIPANLAGTTVNAPAPPAAPAHYEFSVDVAGTLSVLGTLTIGTDASLTLPTCPATTVNFGDAGALKIVGTPDTTWADVAWSFMFHR